MTVGAAQAALESGDPEHAVEILQKLATAYPKNTDILRRLANAQAAAGRYRAALATIDRAAGFAPLDNDIVLAKARILLWSGKAAEAKSQADIVARRAPDYPDLPAVQRAIAQRMDRPLRGGAAIYAGISGVEYKNGYSTDWHTAGGSLFVRLDDLTSIAGLIDYESRDTADTRYGFRLDRRFSDHSAYVAAAVTPDAHFRESWNIALGDDYAMSSNLALTFDLKHSHYATNDVTSANPGVRWYVMPDLSLTARWINLFQTDGGFRNGILGRADYLLSENTSIFAGAATYPETESGITRQVHAAFAGIILPMSDRLFLRGTAEYETRVDSYTRKAVTVALDWRFGNG